MPLISSRSCCRSDFRPSVSKADSCACGWRLASSRRTKNTFQVHFWACILREMGKNWATRSLSAHKPHREERVQTEWADRRGHGTVGEQAGESTHLHLVEAFEQALLVVRHARFSVLSLGLSRVWPQGDVIGFGFFFFATPLSRQRQGRRKEEPSSLPPAPRLARKREPAWLRACA